MVKWVQLFKRALCVHKSSIGIFHLNHNRASCVFFKIYEDIRRGHSLCIVVWKCIEMDSFSFETGRHNNVLLIYILVLCSFPKMPVSEHRCPPIAIEGTKYHRPL